MHTQSVQAIYASTSGNTELVVEAVADRWRAGGLTVELHRAEQTSPVVLTSNSTFLLATSTWEHGNINRFFYTLFDALKSISCAGKRAAFIGLGDTRYEPVLFCGGMEMLRERWLAQQGREIGQRLKINGEPHAFLTTSVAQWADAILEDVQKL